MTSIHGTAHGAAILVLSAFFSFGAPQKSLAQDPDTSPAADTISVSASIGPSWMVLPENRFFGVFRSLIRPEPRLSDLPTDDTEDGVAGTAINLRFELTPYDMELPFGADRVRIRSGFDQYDSATRARFVQTAPVFPNAVQNGWASLDNLGVIGTPNGGEILETQTDRDFDRLSLDAFVVWEVPASSTKGVAFFAGPSWRYLAERTDISASAESPFPPPTTMTLGEDIDTHYLGVSAGVSSSHALAPRWTFSADAVVSLLHVSTEYEGFYSDSTRNPDVSRALSEDTVAIEFELEGQVQFALTEATSLSLSAKGTFLSDAPQMNYGDNSGSNPLRIEYGQMFGGQLSVGVSHRF